MNSDLVNLFGSKIGICEMIITNLGEWAEEATSGGWRDLGGVHRSDHEGVADADAGNEAANNKEGVVGGKAHEDSSGKEDGLG